MSEPKTREQFYWAKLGGQDVELPAPKTRTQEFMKNAAERLAEAGGGLPDPSSYDDGTVLIKVGNEWKAQSGYGYEEEPAFETIEWDGDITGKIVAQGDADNFYKVSDVVLTVGELNGCIAVVTDGNPDHIEEIRINATDIDGLAFSTYVISGDAGNYDDGEVILPEAGTYFINFNSTYPSSLTAPSSVTTIDPKFIPQSGDEFVVQFTAGQGISADKTPDEVFEALGTGKLVKGILSGDVSYFGAAGFTFFGVDDNSLYVQSMVPNGDEWSYKIYTATLTPDE